MNTVTSIANIATSTAGVVLPPGPRARALNTLRYIQNPVTALSRWRARFGDSFTLRDLAATTLVTCDPTLVEALACVREHDSFAAVAPDSFDVLIGRRSLLLLAGDEHRAARRQLVGPLCRKALPDWAAAIGVAARSTCAELHARGRFVALERTRDLALAMMSKLLFGPDDPGEPVLHRAIIEMMGRVRPSFIVSRLAQVEAGGLTGFGRYMIASRAFDRLLDERIARARDRAGEDHSILALLLASHDDDELVRGQLRTLLIGGHETVASLLAWALYYVHRDRELLAELRAEVDRIGDDADLSRSALLEAVIDETLRIRPPPGQCFRTLTARLELGPWVLPAGTMVSPAICLLHHHEDHWVEPARFDPGRFRAGPRPSPFVYMPFGLGYRRCVGAALARVEAAIVLGTLLRELELELDEPNEPAWAREGIAMCPRPGVRMRVVRRRKG